ncbi:PREDICTED: venom allergen 3 [Drosophila arizonae]|uniref:Venom allergen 3 n=1 Tax=Drosophila arizonae TaxID=7263 RepID=A0ABM1P9P2_DROAR|nr:PREDICTED: venom allergen 3 [Drosophila arizonae]
MPHYTKHLLAIVSLVILQQVDCQDAAKNYCQPGLCPSLRRHIGCKNNGELSKTCPPTAKLLNITEYQAIILNQHNQARNLLASGKLEGLRGPEKMATMQWNEELELLATLNVKQCAKHYDACHNTLEFRNSGQNVALAVINRTDISNEQLVNSTIDSWWDQYKNITQQRVDYFPKESKLSDPVRNFAVMARDNNTHVGCAAIRFSKGPVDNFLMTCNYASNFMPEHAIYRVKSLNCQGGYDRVYPALCKAGELYREVETVEPNMWGNK